MAQERPLPPGYPVEWEADVVLRDGSLANIRPITPEDGEGIRIFHARQSDESIYLRFFAPLRELSNQDIERFTVVDYERRVALVAIQRDELIGVGRYDCVDEHTAEIAFNISDHHQGKGIGSVLLEHLAAIGLEAGLKRFVAEVLPQNRKMLNVFKEAGYGMKHRLEDGVIAVTFDITPTARSTAVRMAREHRAEASSIRGVLTPRSVAVIGASRREHAVGSCFLHNILTADFVGDVYAVNPSGAKIFGLSAYPTIGDVPGHVDLAVIAVPAASVLHIVEECAAKGVKALVIPVANFGDADEVGQRLQDRLRVIARRAGIRIIGPNSFGVINNDWTVRLNASLARAVPPPGTFGLFAQSGALGIAVLASAARRGLGLSTFASAGNRVDVSGNDLMQFWIDDPDTDAVGLYLESIGNPRKFSRIARQLSSNKPVIVVKSGATVAGPGSLGQGERRSVVGPEAFDALLRQAGVIRAENIHQLFDVAQLVVHQPLPQGDRVAIVGNSDALGSLTEQAALSWGLRVTHGPVSLLPGAGAGEFAHALREAFLDPEVDSVLTSFVPPTRLNDREVAEAVRDEAARWDKPCAATFLEMRGVREELAVGDPNEVRRRVVPAYMSPEDAVRALAAATFYGQWRARDRGLPVAPYGVDHLAAQAFIDGILEECPQGRALTQEETTRLLATAGIELWPSEVVATAEEAVAAAERCGYPVILKTISPSLRHQGGLTGLRPDLSNADGVRHAYASLSNRLGALADDRFAVQAMSPPGVPCVVGSVEDELFGPLVSFSIAGPPTDLLGDIGYRSPPLTDVDVRDLVSSVRAAPLLRGDQRREPIHMDALRDLVARAAVLADEHPDLAALTLNPVNCWGSGVDVLGAEIRVAPHVARVDADRRLMTF